MKKLLTILCFVPLIGWAQQYQPTIALPPDQGNSQMGSGAVLSTSPPPSYSSSSPQSSYSYQGAIEDGWHNAIVDYFNYGTGHNAEYTLQVRVESSQVIEILFPDGGNIHTGYNQEGYEYTGGDLTYKHRLNGSIKRGTTTVTTYKGNTILEYQITIQ